MKKIISGSLLFLLIFFMLTNYIISIPLVMGQIQTKENVTVVVDREKTLELEVKGLQQIIKDEQNVNIVIGISGIVASAGFGILGYFLAKRDTKSRESLEHDHYKEKITSELWRLLDLVNTNAEIYQSGMNDPRSLELNRTHAESSTTRLSTINSQYAIPPHIRSEFDEILANYTSLLENMKHGCIRKDSYETLNKELATVVRDFLNRDFFTNATNEVIEINMRRINQVFSRIFKI